MLKVRQICKDSKEGVRVILIDPVGLPIDLMDVIGVFVDPVGVWVILIDPVGLPNDLIEVMGIFVDP